MLVFIFLLFSSLAAGEYSPSIAIFDSPEDLGAACAEIISERLERNQNRTILGLATGNTPIPVYKALTKIIKERNLDLSQLITFNLDEYLGIPAEDLNSYHSFMYVHFFSELLESPSFPNGIKPENIHIPNGYAKQDDDLTSTELASLQNQFPLHIPGALLSKEEELWIIDLRVQEYEKLIASLGPIDIQILGIGTNGHIGFAEPGSSFTQGTSLVQLSENTRKDNALLFREGPVPLNALTMGIGTILQAKEIFLLATGEKKANIIQKALSEEISSEIPATALRLHPNVTIFLDQSASSKLH